MPIEPKRPKLYIGEAALDLPEPEWLIPGFVQKGGLTVIYGEPGAGKSLLMLDWANVIQYGWQWFGRPTSRGQALYLMAEGQYGLRNRLLAWKANRNADRLPDVAYSLDNFSLWRPAGQPEPTAEQAGIIGVVDEMAVDVVFIDTLAATFGGGNENSQQDMNMYLDIAREFQERGASVILSHHVTKESKTLRGSTVLSGAADTLIRMDPKRNPDNPAIVERVRIYCDKQKDYVPFSPFVLDVEQVELGEREDGSLITSVVYVAGTEKVRTRDDQRDDTIAVRKQHILALLEDAPEGLKWTEDIFPHIEGSNEQKSWLRDDLERSGYIYRKRGRWFMTVAEEPEEL